MTVKETGGEAATFPGSSAHARGRSACKPTGQASASDHLGMLHLAEIGPSLPCACQTEACCCSAPPPQDQVSSDSLGLKIPGFWIICVGPLIRCDLRSVTFLLCACFPTCKWRLLTESRGLWNSQSSRGHRDSCDSCAPSRWELAFPAADAQVASLVSGRAGQEPSPVSLPGEPMPHSSLSSQVIKSAHML